MQSHTPLENKPAVLVATHPRSGTHLTVDLLRRNFPALNSRKRLLETLDTLYLPIDIAIDDPHGGAERIRKLAARHRYPILKSHWLSPDFTNLSSETSDLRDWLQSNVSYVYVIRDPKKVIASHFLFTQMFSEVDDLQSWFDGAVKNWCDHVNRWINVDKVTVICFDDIVRDPRGTVHRFADVLNQPFELNDPILPPRLYSKWRGRMYRIFSTTSPSTEILTRQQGQSFDQLFGEIDTTKIGRASDLYQSACSRTPTLAS